MIELQTVESVCVQVCVCVHNYCPINIVTTSLVQ